MGIFSSDKKKLDRVQTASDVKKAYDSHIEHFLKKVDAQSRNLNPFQEREEPLDTLLIWGDNVFFERRELSKQVDKHKERFRSLETQIEERNRYIEQLKETVDAKERELRQATAENKTNREAYDREIEKLTRTHTKNIEKERRAHQEETSVLQRSWDEEKVKVRRQYERDIATDRRKWNEDVEGWRRKYEQDIAAERNKRESDNQKWEKKYNLDMGKEKREQQSLRERHEIRLAGITAEHSAETTKLVGQLLVNQKEYQGWPDDKLKLKFKELQGLIESITAPNNRELLIPPNAELGKHLDPTNFIGRVGRGKSHFFLQSAIWSVLREQFFSTLFGFGALGPGKPQRELMKVYYAWRNLLEQQTGRDLESSDNEAPSIFYHDELANNWRSATFQCVYAAITMSDGRSPLTKIMSQNVEQTVARIISILSDVSSLSGSRVRPETKNDVRQMVDLASGIAIQFGAHPAQLKLLIPARGEQIKIGESYHDCEDGDAYKGSVNGVDLVTAPGLQKIGDGASDMSSNRTVVPCEIYPIVTN